MAVHSDATVSTSNSAMSAMQKRKPVDFVPLRAASPIEVLSTMMLSPPWQKTFGSTLSWRTPDVELPSLERQAMKSRMSLGVKFDISQCWKQLMYSVTGAPLQQLSMRVLLLVLVPQT